MKPTAVANVPSANQNSWSSRWSLFKSTSPSGSSVILTVGANYLLAGFGLVSGTLAARLLGPSGRGELAAMQNLFWLGGVLVMLGLEESALYFAAREPSKAGRYLATAALSAIILTPFLFALIYPVVPWYLSGQSPELISVTRWILLGIPLYVLVIIPTFTLRGMGSIVSWNLMRIMPGVAWLMLIAMAWVANHRSPVFLAYGYLGILAVLLIPTAILVQKEISGPYWPAPKLVKPMLRYGLPLAVADIHQTLNLRLDQLLIPMFLPSYSLGLYVVAVAWSSAAYPVLLAIGNVLCPRIAGDLGSREVRTQSLAQGVRMGSLAGVLLAIALLALTPAAVPLLFGDEFSPAVPVALILVGASVLHGINCIMEEGLRGLGEPKGIFWAEAAGLAATIVSLAAMLRPLGILGAGIASVIGYGLTFVVLACSIKHTSGIALRVFLIPRLEDARVLESTMSSWRRTFFARGVK
jgi:O-antigen/teichoic acid export membrane protein